jgi:hypothetical protein
MHKDIVLKGLEYPLAELSELILANQRLHVRNLLFDLELALVRYSLLTRTEIVLDQLDPLFYGNAQIPSKLYRMTSISRGAAVKRFLYRSMSLLRL